MDDIREEYVRHLVQNEGMTLSQISEKLKRCHPNQRGLSERSVRRYCKEHGITRRSNISNEELDDVVRNSVSKVGPTWGRKMLTGFLKSNAITVSERRVGSSLVRVAPSYHHQRQDRAKQQLNPIPYQADYFGHKLHVDQNEKLVMYGVVHVCATDGYSGKVVSHALMPVKNNLLIYDNIFRSVVLTYGMWDQLRVDMGREFCLMLFIQDVLKEHRRNPSRLPYIQSTSKENHRAERIWVEMNHRVNYPLKRALNAMVNNEEIDMEDEITKFAVSWVTMKICHTGCKQVIDAWNSHCIPGKGAPNDLQRNDKTKPVLKELVPTGTEAAELYQERGGHLTFWPEFGQDPLWGTNKYAKRLEDFYQQFPHLNELFYEVTNNRFANFSIAVILYRDLTYHYYSRS
ncbi:uncharacterized protein [Montipora capricornis]|uniref:uncharacterized protein isoform X2 n=1 Tax=Montipora capricornis TaxID=246305 RepID=UPI0035F1E9E3